MFRTPHFLLLVLIFVACSEVPQISLSDARVVGGQWHLNYDFRCQNPVRGMAWSPDGSKIAVFFNDNNVWRLETWDALTHETLQSRLFGKRQLNSVTWSSSLPELALNVSDDSITPATTQYEIISASNLETLRVMPNEGRLDSSFQRVFSLKSDSPALALTLKLWSGSTFTLEREILVSKIGLGIFNSFSTNKELTRALLFFNVNSQPVANTASIVVVDLITGVVLHVYDLRDQRTSFGRSNPAKTEVAFYTGGIRKVFSLETGIWREISQKGLLFLNWSTDGTRLVYADDSGIPKSYLMQVLDAQTGNLIWDVNQFESPTERQSNPNATEIIDTPYDSCNVNIFRQTQSSTIKTLRSVTEDKSERWDLDLSSSIQSNTEYKITGMAKNAVTNAEMRVSGWGRVRTDGQLTRGVKLAAQDFETSLTLENDAGIQHRVWMIWNAELRKYLPTTQNILNEYETSLQR
jgi:hypothetical protein